MWGHFDEASPVLEDYALCRKWHIFFALLLSLRLCQTYLSRAPPLLLPLTVTVNLITTLRLSIPTFTFNILLSHSY